MTPQTFDVEGLRCGGCVNTVRTVLSALDGVHAVDVELNADSPSTVTVEADTELDLDAVQRSLTEHGDFRIRR